MTNAHLPKRDADNIVFRFLFDENLINFPILDSEICRLDKKCLNLHSEKYENKLKIT